MLILLQELKSLGIELQTERKKLIKKLERHSLTDHQIKDIMDITAEMGRDVEMFRQDFESRRLLIEWLNVHVTLRVENGQKIADVEAVISKGQESLLIETQITRSPGL